MQRVRRWALELTHWLSPYEKKIASRQRMLPLLEKIVHSERPLLIIPEDVAGEALAMLVVKRLRGGLKVAAVKAPSPATAARSYWKTSRFSLSARWSPRISGSG